MTPEDNLRKDLVEVGDIFRIGCQNSLILSEDWLLIYTCSENAGIASHVFKFFSLFVCLF